MDTAAASASAVVVLRGPVVPLAGAAAADRRQRQRGIGNDGVGLQAFAQRRVELGELVSAGALGLMKALDSFDLSRGLAFSTYAVLRIRGAILDSLRTSDWAPRLQRKRARLIDAHAADGNARDLHARRDLVRARVVVRVQRAPQDDEHRQEGGDKNQAFRSHPCTVQCRKVSGRLRTPASSLSRASRRDERRVRAHGRQARQGRRAPAKGVGR